MTHRNRGHISHTWDIKRVLSVDLNELSITYEDVAHAEPQTARLRVRQPTEAAGQLLNAVSQSISVHGDGRWESSQTLQRTLWATTKIADALHDHGIDEFGAVGLNLQLLRTLIEDFDSSLKRTLNRLLARALRAHHPNGDAIGRALQNTTYMVREPKLDLYDDIEADAIRHSAQGVFHAAFTAQKRLLAELGYDTAGRAWLRIPAEEVIADCRRRHPTMTGSPQPRIGASRVDQIDWALLNPAPFGLRLGRSGSPIGRAMLEIGEGLYPPNYVLTAALILHCFVELSGLNQSVMLRTTPSDLISTGTNNAILDVAKARNHTEDGLAVRTESNNTLGGLIEALAGLTRFARHFRVQHFSGREVPEVADRLYVEHRENPAKAQVLSSQRMHHGWRHTAFDTHWNLTGLDRTTVGLRFNAIRRKVLERAITANPRGDVHGHSARTRVHYLANVLPEYTLVKQATAAQDDIIDRALNRFTTVSQPDNPNAKRLAAAEATGATADVIASVCVSGGNDPDDNGKPCSLGLAACFTCSNGYRTVDHIPGLLATVAYTELIRDNDPDEWENGDAGPLHFYATETLKQFSSALVDGVKESVDLRGHMLTINGLYTELRR